MERAWVPGYCTRKIDVERAEMDVLHGASSFMTACRPMLLVEANSDRDLASLRDHWLDMAIAISSRIAFPQ